jgi:hypothetical protein
MKKLYLAAILSAAFLFVAFTGGFAQADELPPQGSQPLSKILQSVEKKDLGRISEAEFDHGLWEVKVCKEHACEKLYIKPQNGHVVRRKNKGPDDIPPEGATPVSKIVKSIEAHQLGTITELEFEHGMWNVDLKISASMGASDTSNQ